MLCDVTQLVRSEKIQIGRQIELDDALANSYERMKRDGWRFAADLLPTGHVATTIERSVTDFLDVKVVDNDRELIHRAFQTMLMRCFPCRGRDLQHTIVRNAP